MFLQFMYNNIYCKKLKKYFNFSSALSLNSNATFIFLVLHLLLQHLSFPISIEKIFYLLAFSHLFILTAKSICFIVLNCTWSRVHIREIYHVHFLTIPKKKEFCTILSYSALTVAFHVHSFRIQLKVKWCNNVHSNRWKKIGCVLL